MFPSLLLRERGDGREEFEENSVALIIRPSGGCLRWPEPMSPFQQLVLEGDLRAERLEATKMLAPHEIIGSLTSSPLATLSTTVSLHRFAGSLELALGLEPGASGRTRPCFVL
jgi:hypothetical protein